jgi:hypothetical protein
LTEERKEEESEEKRILKEEILGVIPALALSDKKKGRIAVGIYCGLVFATKIIIVAFLERLTASQSIGRGHYFFMKREWAQYVHKPTAEILNDSKRYSNCYIIPYSNISHVSFGSLGRIRKRSILRIHTDERVYTFYFATDIKTLQQDVDQLLRAAGVRVSHGEAGDF